MERLTERDANCADPKEIYGVRVKNHDYISAANRLADYEDTQPTPEEIDMDHEAAETLRQLRRNCDLDRLEKLAEADKAGRLVVLPCKVGDTAYWVHGAVITECKVYRIQKNRNGLYICLKSNVSHGAFRTDLSFGKIIFLTREAAEKALEAMK